ncbi:MAG: hypothetical protein KJS98_06350 [Nitrospirae bacterium]|nr:hypothetical protein [Nitrospirota bacterium]MDE3050482.1 hypothetical protein [Nitrospirota bacterium]
MGRWCAEEEGLRESLLNRDHTTLYRYSLPHVFERYAMGLQDGHALIRLARVDWHLATSHR